MKIGLIFLRIYIVIFEIIFRNGTLILKVRVVNNNIILNELLDIIIYVFKEFKKYIKT